jgi:hypothetical protein
VLSHSAPYLLAFYQRDYTITRCVAETVSSSAHHYLIHFPDGISAIPVLECRFSPRQQLYSYLSSAPTVHVTTRFLSIAPLPYQHDFFSNRRIPPSVSCLHSFVAEPALNAGLLYACLPPYQQETACVDSDIGALDRRVRDRVVDAVCSLWIVRC